MIGDGFTKPKNRIVLTGNSAQEILDQLDALERQNIRLAGEPIFLVRGSIVEAIVKLERPVRVEVKTKKKNIKISEG